MHPTPTEALLKASVEVRKRAGLKPGQPVRLDDLKSEYFKQRPAPPPQPQRQRQSSEKKQAQASREMNEHTSAFTPVTAPDKPVVERDVEGMLRAFKEGRKKK